MARSFEVLRKRMAYELAITDPEDGIGAFFCFAESFAQQIVVDGSCAHEAFDQALAMAINEYTFFMQIFPSFVDDEFLYDFGD